MRLKNYRTDLLKRLRSQAKGFVKFVEKLRGIKLR